MGLPTGTTNVALSLHQILVVRLAISQQEYEAQDDENRTRELQVIDAEFDRAQLRCERALDRERSMDAAFARRPR